MENDEIPGKSASGETVDVIADKDLFEKKYGFLVSDFNFYAPITFAKSLASKTGMQQDEIEALAETIEMFLHGFLPNSLHYVPVNKDFQTAEELFNTIAFLDANGDFFNIQKSDVIDRMEKYAAQYQHSKSLQGVIEVIEGELSQLADWLSKALIDECKVEYRYAIKTLNRVLTQIKNLK